MVDGGSHFSDCGFGKLAFGIRMVVLLWGGGLGGLVAAGLQLVSFRRWDAGWIGLDREAVQMMLILIWDSGPMLGWSGNMEAGWAWACI